jgi:hypothetical protein
MQVRYGITQMGLPTSSLCPMWKNITRSPMTAAQKKAFIMHKDDGVERRFRQSDKGLFYLDTAEAKELAGTVLLVNTVAGNKTRYTNRNYKQAQLAREVHSRIGRPSLRTYLKIVENNLLPNQPAWLVDQTCSQQRISLAQILGHSKGKQV